MTYWLYNALLLEDPDREPRFALQSTINWMLALKTEIEGEHGKDPREQLNSCVNYLKNKIQGMGPISGKSEVFESLYSSLNYSLAVIHLASDACGSSRSTWLIPTMIVSWYYCYYNSFRSILASCNAQTPDNHTGVIKAVNNTIINKLPYPLNIFSEWSKNEEYRLVLPGSQFNKGIPLHGSFDNSRECAQQMLIGYLSGTTDREVDILKGKLSKKYGFDTYRSKDARAERDKALNGTKFNFLSCAFRYRGKANYRDGIFITYGSRNIYNSRIKGARLELNSA